MHLKVLSKPCNLQIKDIYMYSLILIIKELEIVLPTNNQPEGRNMNSFENQLNGTIGILWI